MSAEWVAEGRISVQGTSLEYATWGPKPGKAPTLVMLHEGLGAVSTWRDMPERLAQATGFGVVAYSRAGYGQSDPAALPRPLDYMTREAVDVLPHVLDSLSVQDTVLLGHSDGATIAAIYAGSVVDMRVRGMVLAAPHFFTEVMGLEAIAQARADFEAGNLRDRLARHHRDPEATFNGWADVWLASEFPQWNVSEVIDYLRIPTLAIQGEHDTYGTLAQIRELEERSYAPVDPVILKDCGHDPFRDQPDAVLAAVSEFCGRLVRIEAAAGAPA